jgi:predicted DCC family thiol-disulfide oxidoreductase YuxK
VVQTLALVRPVVLFDGDCRFCRWSARALERIDRRRRLAFLPFDDPRAEALLHSVPADERRTHVWLADAGGGLSGGGAAAVRLLSLLGSARVARLPGIATVIGRGYDAVSSARGRLGRLVPDGPAPRRFP